MSVYERMPADGTVQTDFWHYNAASPCSLTMISFEFISNEIKELIKRLAAHPEVTTKSSSFTMLLNDTVPYQSLLKQ